MNRGHIEHDTAQQIVSIVKPVMITFREID